MIHLPVVFGEWVVRDRSWFFVVDSVKGGRMFTLHDGCTHREIAAMAEEDFSLDKKTDVVVLSYPLPDSMLQHLGGESPPIYVTNDRQVQTMVELARTHGLRLCVSTRLGKEVETNEAEEEDFVDGDNENVDEEDNEYEEDEEWEEDASDGSGSVCNGDGDGKVDLETDEMIFKKHADTYCDDVDYTVYGKVKGEEAEYDEDFKNYELDGFTNRFGQGGKSWSDGLFLHRCFDSKRDVISELRLTAIMSKFAFRVEKSDTKLFVAGCCVDRCQWKLRAAEKNEPGKFWVTIYKKSHTCSLGDRRFVSRRHTPQYIGWLFIESFGIIDGITPKHIKASMKKQYGIKMSYTTSYRALLHA